MNDEKQGVKIAGKYDRWRLVGENMTVKGELEFWWGWGYLIYARVSVLLPVVLLGT